MTDTQKTQLVARAKELIEKPYKYGASLEEAPNVFDCSSFTQYLFKQIGIEIPRSSILQAADKQGKEIEPESDFSNLKAGDLLFMSGIAGHYDDELFSGTRRYIGHVVIYLGNSAIIQAKKYPGKVFEQPLAELLSDPRYEIVLVKRF